VGKRELADNSKPRPFSERLKRDLPFSRLDATLPPPSDEAAPAPPSSKQPSQKASNAAAELRRKLERSAKTEPILPVKKAQRLPRFPTLIGIEPKSEGEKAEPETPAHLRGRNGESVQMPKVNLNSAKILETVEIKKRAVAPVPPAHPESAPVIESISERHDSVREQGERRRC